LVVLAIGLHRRDSLTIICGDFNRLNLQPVHLLGLINIASISTRDYAALDHIILSDSSCYVHPYPPLIIMYSLLSQEVILNAIDAPSKEKSINVRNTSVGNICLLRTVLKETDFSTFTNPSFNTYTQSVSDYLRNVFDMCCPFMKVSVYPNRLSSPHVKRRHHQKEFLSRIGDYDEMRIYTKLIKAEIKHLNLIFRQQIISTHPKNIWKCINLLTGKVVASSPISDIGKLNNRFIIPPSSNTPPSIQPAVSDIALTPVSPNTVAASPMSIRARCAAGPDGLSPALFRLCPYELADVTVDIKIITLSSGCLPDCWRDVAITPIPKGVSVQSGSMCYTLIANTYILLKLTEKLLLNQVKPTLYMASIFCQFAYKPGSGVPRMQCHIITSDPSLP